NRAPDVGALRHRNRLLPLLPGRVARPRRARQDHRAQCGPARPTSRGCPDVARLERSAPSKRLPPALSEAPKELSRRALRL
ncbi:hypothetical protein LTR94_027449, partial [Friedmanniomyces endolithicus]